MLPLERINRPVINCHTHIFTSRHVPPWLAKKFVFYPIYLLLHAGFLIGVLKWWRRNPGAIIYKPYYKYYQKMRLRLNYFVSRIQGVYQAVGWILTIQTFFFIYDWLTQLIAPNNIDGISWIEQARQFLNQFHLLYKGDSVTIKLLIILFILFLLIR